MSMQGNNIEKYTNYFINFSVGIVVALWGVQAQGHLDVRPLPSAQQHNGDWPKLFHQAGQLYTFSNTFTTLKNC